MYRIQERYQKEIVPQLMREFTFKNVMQVPRIKKVVVNIGVGSETQTDSKALDAAVSDLIIVTGQKPVVTKARKSIANFKLREGVAIGVKVTLRGDRMWAFFDRLVVQGVNVRKKHQKQAQTQARQRQIRPGIIQFEAPISAANVMLVCPNCSKPARVGLTRDAEGPHRVCKNCGKQID